MIYALLCNTFQHYPTHFQTASLGHRAVLMHLVYLGTCAIMKCSYLMASLLLYAPVNSFHRRKKKESTECLYIQYAVLALNQTCIKQ